MNWKIYLKNLPRMQHRKTKQAKNIKVKFKKMESRTMRSSNNLFEVPQGEKLTRKSQDVKKSWLKLFPELMKDTYPHILESQPTPKQEEEKENSLPWHTVVTLPNSKHKTTTTMKAARREGQTVPKEWQWHWQLPSQQQLWKPEDNGRTFFKHERKIAFILHRAKVSEINKTRVRWRPDPHWSYFYRMPIGRKRKWPQKEVSQEGMGAKKMRTRLIKSKPMLTSKNKNTFSEELKKKIIID